MSWFSITDSETQNSFTRREEKPSIRGQGRRMGGATHAWGQGWRWEELPRAMAARAQEGLEELSHIEGQEGQRWGDTPRPS